MRTRHSLLLHDRVFISPFYAILLIYIWPGREAKAWGCENENSPARLLYFGALLNGRSTEHSNI